MSGPIRDKNGNLKNKKCFEKDFGRFKKIKILLARNWNQSHHFVSLEIFSDGAFVGARDSRDFWVFRIFRG